MYGTVFVFGSNREGRHGKGAALTAVREYGAVYGRASGPQGLSYAIVTKELRRNFPTVSLGEVQEGVREFIQYAVEHPDTEFLVTPIGCGLAGFTPEQIAPMFVGSPKNVILPDVFKKILT